MSNITDFPTLSNADSRAAPVTRVLSREDYARALAAATADTLPPPTKRNITAYR